jgi:hypothetical protein
MQQQQQWRSNIVFLCMQLNVADGDFQESIFRTAIERGRVALLNNDVNGDGNDEDGETPPSQSKTMLGQIPKQLSMQVGGMASHKSMVLKLDQYILKPFGTTITAEESAKKKKQQQQQQQEQDNTLSTPQDDDTTKGGKEEDVTKTFRGVREMAFYEAIEFANSLSFSHEDVKYKLEMLIRDKYKLYTLSDVVSSIWSCRYPCTGHPIRKGTNVTKIHYSIDAIMLLMAYFTGDSAVNHSMESYTVAWHMLIKEMHALKKLSNLTSPYFGVVDSETLGQQQQQPHQHQSPLPQSTMMMQRPHLLLQNLTAQFRKPNIIDIKMGTQTYEPTAPHNKQQKEISKYIHQSEFGFRIVGMGVHQSSGQYKYWDKNYGVSLTTMDEVTNALSTFFRCNDEAVVANKKRGDDIQHISNTLSVVIDKLNQIKEWFEVDNPSLAFYASSILIVYEGDYNQGDEKVMSINNEKPVVKIIDFAHVCRQTGTDLGYITGVRNLINVVEGLRSKTF